jgi:hypothetical protein
MRASCFDFFLAIFPSPLVKSYRLPVTQLFVHPPFMQYHYRLIAFPKGQSEPVLSLNLESNPAAGTCCLGAHLPEGHHNLGFAEQKMSQSDFRAWALDTAKRYLGLTQSPAPIPEGGLYISNDDEDSGPDLHKLTADSFQIAHEYVDFRNNMNKKAGGFLGMFRKIDYGAINSSAIELDRKFASLLDAVLSAIADNEGHPLARPLLEYTEALCTAVNLTKQKTDMMLKLSQKPGSIHWDQFNDIIGREDDALRRCQSTGDRLTTLFRSM